MTDTTNENNVHHDESCSVDQLQRIELLHNTLPLRFIHIDNDEQVRSNNKIYTTKLAKELNVSRMSVHRWIKGDNMSIKSLNSLINLSKNSLCERKGLITSDVYKMFIGL